MPWTAISGWKAVTRLFLPSQGNRSPLLPQSFHPRSQRIAAGGERAWASASSMLRPCFGVGVADPANTRRPAAATSTPSGDAARRRRRRVRGRSHLLRQRQGVRHLVVPAWAISHMKFSLCPFRAASSLAHSAAHGKTSTAKRPGAQEPSAGEREGLAPRMKAAVLAPARGRGPRPSARRSLGGRP